jgi:hypothetical protein
MSSTSALSSAPCSGVLPPAAGDGDHPVMNQKSMIVCFVKAEQRFINSPSHSVA